MSGSPPLPSRVSRQSSVDRCDSNQPSSSFLTPQQSTYIEIPPDQQTFLDPSAYAQISYEVEDASTTFNYSYNPRRALDSNAMKTSKYLEDSPYTGRSVLDASEHLFANAPASVPSNFTYSSELQEPGSVMNIQSPPDDARFSTPEFAPDSIKPISAPMSWEIPYVRSPSEESEVSNLNTQETLLVVGQPAKNATLKDVQKIRYESPKNHDESWIMEAFYSSSEEFNSPDNMEITKSNDVEEVTRLDTDESDGRVSIVDRLFAMLQRAEGESGDEEDEQADLTFTMDASTSQVNNTTLTESPRVSAQVQQTQFQSQIAHCSEAPQFTIPQNVHADTSQFSEHHVRMDYVDNRYHSSQLAQPSYFPSMPPSISQYPPQYAPQQLLVGQNAQLSSLQPPPGHPMFFAAPPPMYPAPPQQQYFHSDQTPFGSQFSSQNCLPAQLPYQPCPESWSINSYEPQDPSGRLEQLPQKPEVLQQVTSSIDKNREDFTSDSPISSERSYGSIPSSSQSEYETGTDFESASIMRSISSETPVEQSHPKGPPFEQKGPTRTKEIAPVPPPPPPSPEEERNDKHDSMDTVSIIHQLEREAERLEEMSIYEIANYERQAEVEELRTRMCERFERLYPNLFSKEDNDSNPRDEAADIGDIDDGDPEEGQVIRNGIQLTTRYLALWFPDKKERAHMIPWNIVRKVKPIRLCFLDNRIGHGEYEEFNMGEFVNVTGHMMFAYGDGPEALDETRLFMLDIVRQQMNMLLRRVWHIMMQNHDRKIFTYFNIFGLYKNHPVRLRRLVRYLLEQSRRRHMLYRVMVDQGRRRGQTYFENRMDVNLTGSTEVACLRKRAPHIYQALIDAGFEDKLEFLCEERRIQDCDPALAKIKMFLKKRNRHLSAEHKELLDYARRVSYCSRTGRLSAFRAHRFHEFLGFPDLQTDLIYVLDFIAREIVLEVTYHASLARHMEREELITTSAFPVRPLSREKLVAESLELCYYEQALRTMKGWRKNSDILFGEEEQPVMLSYGKNPWKWESDHDYNKREMAERQEMEKNGPWPSRYVYVSSAEVFEEHKKVLKGEYWDSNPEDLTKEAFVLANAYAAARQARLNIPEPPVPAKWLQRNQQANKEEQERLQKLREMNRQGDLQKRLTEQLVKMMADSSIEDTGSILETDGELDVEKMAKLIHATAQKHQNILKQ